jgi:hypothetical protein
MINQAPVGSLMMFSDGAGNSTPQIAGSVDIFPRSFLYGAVIQVSSSLHVNGLLEDKAVKHQTYVINIPGATPTTYNLTTQAQWYSTGSYVLFKESTSAGIGNVTLNIHNAWTTPGLSITIQKIGRSDTFKSDVSVVSNTINGTSRIYTSTNDTGFTTITSPYTSYNTSIELISDGTNWYTKNSHGSWTGS